MNTTPNGLSRLTTSEQWIKLGLSREPQSRVIALAICIYMINFGALCASFGLMRLRTDIVGYGQFVMVGLVFIWMWTPRFFVKLPKPALIEEDLFPELTQLVESVAAHLGVTTPRIFMTERFTAAYTRVGKRRRPFLVLGHSLLSLLDSAELVTIIAHELTHDRDGSFARHFLVRLAITAWHRWCRLVWIFAELDSVPQVRWIGLAIRYSVLQPSLALGRLLTASANSDQRFAECYADYMAQWVAQPASIKPLLKKIEVVKKRAEVGSAYNRARGGEKFFAIRSAYAAVPEQTQRAIWNELLEEVVEGSSTHPSVEDRLAVCKAVPNNAPLVRLDAGDFGRIQQELIKWPSVLAARERAFARQKPRRVRAISVPQAAPMLLRSSVYYHQSDDADES